MAIAWAMRWLARAFSGHMRREKVEGLVRHGLTTLGALLVADGMASEATIGMLIEMLTGAAMAALGLVWSAGAKETA